MGLRSQRWSVLSLVIAGPGLALVFWLLAGFVPIPAPSLSADEVAARYAANAGGIRLAMVMFVALWTTWIPFSGALAAQLSRREPGFPLWSLVGFGGGLLVTMIVTLGGISWGLAAYRPERAPDVIQALHDLGWFLFVMPAGPLGLQILGVSIVTLADRGPAPPFPRWFGFVSLWCFTLTMPGLLIMLFHSGPFAWNGLLAFWLPLAAIGVWASILVPLLLRAIAAQAATSSGNRR